MAVIKKTSDLKIIAKAKEMDAIVLTNNVKDFIKQDISVVKVSENLKKDATRLVAQMKKLAENVKAKKVDLKAKSGVSLAEQK